jgi:hypothetical protein
MKAITGRAAKLDNDFSWFRTKGQDIQKYVVPWRGRALGGQSKSDDNGESYDDTSIHNTIVQQCLQVASAGIKSGISPSSRPWFRVGVRERKIVEGGPAALWLARVEQILYTIFQRANVYDALQEIFTELLAFGTGAAAVVPDKETIIRVRPFTYGEYRLGLDHRHKVGLMTRKYYMTVGQLVSEFTQEHCSQRVKDLYKDGNLEEKILIRNLIEKSDDRYDLKEALGRAYRSIYWEDGVEGNLVLAIRGFDLFPILSSTWETVGGQVYGIGPGHTNLRNAKRLQKLEEDSLQQLALQNKPPLLSSVANQNNAIDTSPWGVTYDNSPPGNPGIGPLYQVNPNTQEIEFKIERTEKALRDGFFNNIFMMITNSQDNIKTAYQTARMMEEKYSVLGPVIERSQHMLGDLIAIAYDYAQQAGEIPEPPEELQGEDLKIEYISVLAQAQKISGLQSINDTMAFVASIAQVWPEARHKVDAMQAVDEIASVNGTPPSVIRSDDDASAMVAAEQQAAQRAQQAEQAMMATEGARNLKDVRVGGKPAIDSMAQAMAGQVPGANPGGPQNG